jgi:hypothetical protein
MRLVAALTAFGFQYAVRAGVTAPGSPPAGWLLAAVAGWTWPRWWPLAWGRLPLTLLEE